MKKTIKTISKVFGICFISGSIITSCSTEATSELKDLPTVASSQVFKQMLTKTSSHPILKNNETELLENIIKELGYLTNDPNFKFDLYTEVLKQRSGDYNVKISELAKEVKSSEPYHNSVLTLSTLAEEYKQISNGVDLIVYYPRSINFEKGGITPNYSSKNEVTQAEFVVMNQYDDDYSSPAYVVDEKGDVVYSQNITEEYAMSNDVYIVGSESMMSTNDELMLEPTDPYAGGGGGSGTTYIYRTEGRAEDGGKIQVTDMNAIEHWTAGKFEFRVVVVSGNGLKIKEKSFDQRARDNFKDKRWYDFNEFYFSWNTPNIGNITLESWIEEDSGGEDTEFTMNIPAAYEGGPTFTYKVKSDTNDEELGVSIVQFSDRVGISYGLSHFNFQRQ